MPLGGNCLTSAAELPACRRDPLLPERRRARGAALERA